MCSRSQRRGASTATISAEVLDPHTARLKEELQEARAALRLLSRVGQSLALDDVLQEIADASAELLEAPIAGVFLLDAAGDSFDLVAGDGLDLKGAKFQLSREL